jgi:hypothetical protein
VALGICRLDFSEAGVEAFLRASLRDQLVERLFSKTSQAPAETGAALCAEDLIDFAGSVYSSEGGSLAAVQSALNPMVRQWARRVESARLEEMAEHTRGALLALLPPPQAPRRHWFWRLLVWLLSLLTFGWLPRRRPAEVPDCRLPTRPRSGELQAGLRHAEEIRLRIDQLLVALKQPKAATEAQSVPWEVHIAQSSKVCEAALRCLPEIDEVIGELGQSVPLDRLLLAKLPPDWLRSRIEQVCSQMLKQRHGSVTLERAEYQRLAMQLAAAARILFPWPSDRVHRLALLPGDTGGTVHFPGYERVSGRPEEFVFVVAECGVSLQSLLEVGASG